MVHFFAPEVPDAPTGARNILVICLLAIKLFPVLNGTHEYSMITSPASICPSNYLDYSINFIL